MNALGTRLFWKFYLTVIAGLVVVALSIGGLWAIFGERPTGGWQAARMRFVEAMIPTEDQPPGAVQMAVQRLARALDADIKVFAPDGHPLAIAERPPGPRPKRHHGHVAHHPMPFEFVLSDGRRVVGELEVPYRTFGPGVMIAIAVIVITIGIAAFPVVRQLTGRLERLRGSVEAWGGGALSTRARVAGNDEIAAVGRTFNEAADRIERMIAANRALLANASHELRSPLARLRMAVDLAEEAPSDKIKLEILRNLAELDELVEEILLSSRLDHAGRIERHDPVDLLAIAAEEGARVGAEVSGSPVMVRGDARLLTRLVRNLVQNAVRHGAPPVEIAIERAGDNVRLSVRDHGSGIPAGERSRVFEPFYRPAGHGEAPGGWGLGLALVRQIAAFHGAAIAVEETPGGGATFQVDFKA